MVGKYALILGASSGFGRATALKLSENGYTIFGVHLDRKATLPQVEELKQQIEKNGGRAVYFNVNAADHEKIREVTASIKEQIGNEKIHVVLHSLAFATLKRLIDEPQHSMTRKNLEMTLDVMANSLVYWVQELYWNDLLGEGSRIFAMTSSGSRRAIPYYGAVSAAKAALETYIRQFALELGPRGIKANAINAGVTDTPALRKIPGAKELAEGSIHKNPAGRLTTPEDVANAIYVLSLPESNWINGDVISVDNGESAIEFTGKLPGMNDS
jgi:NAD(P)-dependent dehydrogenase (short-subunit alcohol dehydrogenase family)